jgi:threonine efflux protein
LAAAPAHLSKQTNWQAYRYELVTNLTNPKSLAFFSSVFATLFAPSIALWLKLAGILIVAFISISWNLIVATLFSLTSARKRYGLAKFMVDRLAGGLLVFFGGRLILSR